MESLRAIYFEAAVIVAIYSRQQWALKIKKKNLNLKLEVKCEFLARQVLVSANLLRIEENHNIMCSKPCPTKTEVNENYRS